MNPLSQVCKKIKQKKKTTYQAIQYIRHNLFTCKDNTKLNDYAIQMML